MMRSSILLVLMVLSVSGQRVVFNEDASLTRSPGDSVVVEAAGTPVENVPASDDEVNTRIFGGLLGGLFGGGIKKDVCLLNCGPGNPDISARCCSTGFSQCCFGNFGSGGSDSIFFLSIHSYNYYCHILFLLSAERTDFELTSS